MTPARLRADEGALAPGLLAFAVVAMAGIFFFMQLGDANVLATESRTASDAAALAAADSLRDDLSVTMVHQPEAQESCPSAVRAAAEDYAARNGATVESCQVDWAIGTRSRYAVNVAVVGNEGPTDLGPSNDLSEQRPEWESRAEVEATTPPFVPGNAFGLLEGEPPELAPLGGSDDWENGSPLSLAGLGIAAGGDPTTGPPSPQGFGWPLCAPVTSEYGPRWGRMHHGIDQGAPTGAPIGASADGTVVFAGWQNGYGNIVEINHDGGFQTAYAHMNAIGVSRGQEVEHGDYIGDIGSTGNSTGPHLHLEIRQNGTPYDPRNYLEGNPC